MVSREDLDAGTLADEFIDADYKLDEAVRSYPSFFFVRIVFLGLFFNFIGFPHFSSLLNQ